jgi:hypothetical protein|tara:strand:+ start:304 stop:1242 length:939 start_codon:yes stop_codon:yes gene_type:complete
MYRKLFYNSNCILNTETNVVVFDFNKEWSDYLDWVVDNPELEKKIEDTKGWIEVHPGYLQYGLDAWVGSPIELNKFLLVSWRMGGSEFCKELIRENYPETTPINHWAKSHIILDDELSCDLNDNVKTKVFVTISDPRDVAMNLFHFDNGFHLHDSDYKIDRNNGLHPNSTKFLNEVANKQIELIDYYTKTFGDNCIVLRYEDAFFYQEQFHDMVSNFLGYPPLGIDDIRKYKLSIYKNVGEMSKFFDKDVMDAHYNEYQWFYEKWNYPPTGLHHSKYDWKTNNSRQKTEDYNKMLERNGMSHSDRTNHLYEF